MQCSLPSQLTIKTNLCIQNVHSQIVSKTNRWFDFTAVETDPNRAPECDTNQCVLPDCFCSADGTRIPGGLEPNSVS